ncbi:MAG: hypothetical protein GY953_57710, partial [bacterium]|nr:hypothetical protein [bacterium]
MAKFDVVFEGGGAKGIALVGALDELQQAGHELHRFLGTSAGAITATFCAAGFSNERMLELVTEKTDDGAKPRFTTFMDIPEAASFSTDTRKKSVTMELFRKIDTPFVPSWLEEEIDVKLLDSMLNNSRYARLFSFVERGGFYAGDQFRKWMEEKLAEAGIQPGDTLADFHRKKKTDLTLMVSDTEDMELLALNHRTAPNVPVAWAVRMSMSIPFVWQEVIWRKSWGAYLGRPKAGNIIVDGGMLSNFPIKLIATDDAGVAEIMGADADHQAALDLGLLIDENLRVPGAEDTAKTPKGFTGLRTVQRASRLI